MTLLGRLNEPNAFRCIFCIYTQMIPTPTHTYTTQMKYLRRTRIYRIHHLYMYVVCTYDKCAHTYIIYTCIHTYTHIYSYIRIYVYIYIYICIGIHIHIYTYIQYVHTIIYTYIYIICMIYTPRYIMPGRSP